MFAILGAIFVFTAYLLNLINNNEININIRQTEIYLSQAK